MAITKVKTKEKRHRKIRKNFHLENQDIQIISTIAQSRKISESEVVRTALRELGVKEGAVKDPFAKLIGSVKAGKNLAAKHDEAIYE